MTGRIPWTRYSGEDIESVLATFISLEERDAWKPSDSGLLGREIRPRIEVAESAIELS